MEHGDAAVVEYGQRLRRRRGRRGAGGAVYHMDVITNSGVQSVSQAAGRPTAYGG
jgi:hypothetical protein